MATDLQCTSPVMESFLETDLQHHNDWTTLSLLKKPRTRESQKPEVKNLKKEMGQRYIQRPIERKNNCTTKKRETTTKRQSRTSNEIHSLAVSDNWTVISKGILEKQTKGIHSKYKYRVYANQYSWQFLLRWRIERGQFRERSVKRAKRDGKETWKKHRKEISGN